MCHGRYTEVQQSSVCDASDRQPKSGLTLPDEATSVQLKRSMLVNLAQQQAAEPGDTVHR